MKDSHLLSVDFSVVNPRGRQSLGPLGVISLMIVQFWGQVGQIIG